MPLGCLMVLWFTEVVIVKDDPVTGGFTAVPSNHLKFIEEA